MDAATLEALKKSIEHWDWNSKAEKPEDVRVGRTYCALCDLFWLYACEGCPVLAKTTRKGCSLTPYETALDEYQVWIDNPEYSGFRRHFKAAAQAELDFLKSLLPEGENE